MIKPENHRGQFSRTVLVIFFAFAALQILSGAALFYIKVGWHPASVVEYYCGSETMLLHFPDHPDRFRQPVTWPGRLEVVFAHTLAYGVLIFVLVHLLRASTPSNHTRQAIDRLAMLFFASAAADLLVDLFVLLLPWWGALLKLPAHFAFVGSASVLLLLSLRAIRDAPRANHSNARHDHLPAQGPHSQEKA